MMARTYSLIGSLTALGLAVAIGSHMQGRLDGERDWLTTRAAWDGTGAHRPIAELSAHYGSVHRVMSEHAVHPRLPGAFVLQTPLLLVPEGAVSIFWAGLSALMLIGLVLGLGAHLGLPAGWRAGWLAILLLAPPLWDAFGSGSASLLMAALLVAVPVFVRSDRFVWAGVCFGAAVTLKLFPIILAPLLLLWPATLASAGVFFLAVNAAGLLLPGVTLPGSVASITAAGETWFLVAVNPSLARHVHDLFGVSRIHATLVSGLGCALSVGVLARWAWKGGPPLLPLWFAGVALTVLAPPYSWGHYDVAILPVALVLAAALPGRRGWVVAYALLILFGWGAYLAGLRIPEATLLSRASVIAAMLWLALHQSPSSLDPAADGRFSETSGSRSFG
jgi:hypothetical protein